MPIDANIADLAQYATDFQKLKQLRTENRGEKKSEQNEEAIKRQIQQLKQRRERLEKSNPDIRLDEQGANEIQERGIQLQLQFEDLLHTNPAEILTKFGSIKKQLHLSSQEAGILKSVAKEALTRRKRIKALIDRFTREVAQESGVSSVNKDSDSEFDEQMGRRIFKSLTGKYPTDVVAWTESPLAIAITVYSEDDRQALNSRRAGGHFQDDAEFKFNWIHTKTAPFLFSYFLAQEGVKIHEEAHATFATLDKGIAHFSRRLEQALIGRQDINQYSLSQRFFDEQTGYVGAANKVQKIVNEASANLDSTNLVDKIEQVIKPGIWDYSLGRAKDEIIADFDAESNFYHLNNLLAYTFGDGPKPPADKARAIQLQAYQYLAQAGLTDSNFNGFRNEYNTLVKPYNDELTLNVKFMEQVWDVFSKDQDSELLKRRLIAFMRQNPITVWRVRGESFFREALAKAKKVQDDQKAIEDAKEKRQIDFRPLGMEIRRAQDRLTYDPAIRALSNRQMYTDQVTLISNEFSQLHKVLHDHESDSSISVKDAESHILLGLQEIVKKADSLIAKAKIDANKLLAAHPLINFEQQYNQITQILNEGELWNKQNAVINLIADGIFSIVMNSSEPRMQDVIRRTLIRRIYQDQEITESSISALIQEEGLGRRLASLNPVSVLQAINNYQEPINQLRNIHLERVELNEAEPELTSFYDYFTKLRFQIRESNPYDHQLQRMDQLLTSLSPAQNELIAEMQEKVDHYKQMLKDRMQTIDQLSKEVIAISDTQKVV